MDYCAFIYIYFIFYVCFLFQLKTYLLMSEFDLSWGRAEMCLSLIREGKEVMYVVRAAKDSYDVNRVRANLGKECKVCLQNVSIYEVGVNSIRITRFVIRRSLYNKFMKF